MRGRMNPKNRFGVALIMLLCMAMLFVSPAFAATEGTPPTFVSSEVTDKGDVSITFDQDMADPTGTHGQFTVMVDGDEVVVDSVVKTNTLKKSNWCYPKRS